MTCYIPHIETTKPNDMRDKKKSVWPDGKAMANCNRPYSRELFKWISFLCVCFILSFTLDDVADFFCCCCFLFSLLFTSCVRIVRQIYIRTCAQTHTHPAVEMFALTHSSLLWRQIGMVSVLRVSVCVCVLILNVWITAAVAPATYWIAHFAYDCCYGN